MRKLKIIDISLAFFITLITAFTFNIERESRDQSSLFNVAKNRKSITFIMGIDKSDVPYYSLAKDHFVMDENEKTDLIVNSCITLEGVINYLNLSEERNNQPWSVINIVAHGNPNTGLNLYLYDNGPKATPKRLLQAAITNALPRLKENIVDMKTNINFWSCGIGKNPLMNISLKRIFRPVHGDTAQIYCSPHFVVFLPGAENGSVKRVKASYWPYYYKRGYKPSLSEIELELAKRFPDDDVDWHNALLTEGNSSEVFHQTYHIPVSYTRLYDLKSDRPDLSSDQLKMNWIFSQSDILDQVDEAGIPFDNYHWQVNKIIHTDSDGNHAPAIKAIGMATVLNVLEIN